MSNLPRKNAKIFQKLKNTKIFQEWSHYNGWPTQVKNEKVF
jgi:hypothetical protein